MKTKYTVLFVGYALAHYFNDLLNKLQESCDINITVVTYRGIEKWVGSDVYQTQSNINFNVVELEETEEQVNSYFPKFELGKFKKPSYTFLKNFDTLVNGMKPDIIVSANSHIKMYLYNRNIQKAIKRNKTKLVFRSIPFQLLNYPDVLATEIKNLKELELKGLPKSLSKVIQFTKLDQLYFEKVRKKTLLAHVSSLRKLFNYPDAHALYVPQGKAVYESYGVPASKIYIMLNSPDTDKLLDVNEKLNKQEITRDEYRIVHVGRLIQRKKVDLLIRAVKQIQEILPTINLVVIGTGPEEQNLRVLTKLLGLENAISFKGGIYDPFELGAELKKASIYVLAGMGGLSLNEAMCFGLPIICSVCDGSEKYLLKDGENGFFFKKNDIKDLSLKIVEILTAKELQNKMSKKSLEIIKNEINIHTVCENYNALFTSLINQ